ncbi:MAG TPA: histidine kinase dimerization/phospho-acceptor domain-containing protein [Terriglobales bacterium]|nr:histidine kinase dimerization/phospho-acceptor domain-containing protein [Terriglobales bacterium]
MATVTKVWVSLLIALVLAQTAASLLMSRGSALTIASDLIQGSLLAVATAAFLPNTARSRCPTLHIRLFWILMSVGMLFWLTYQGMWNYFEVLKRQDVPNPFLGDVVLFLHLVPMIAALAVLPHLREDDRDERIRMLDFALLLTWWVFIYIYAVIPWQTVQVDEASYSANFNFAYLTEKLVLLISLAVLAYTAHSGWRKLYGQLLGASALYASSSYVANWAIGHKLYYSGSIYDIPLSVSIAWMAAAPLLALRLDLSDSKPSRPLLGVWITRLSMLALFSLLWAAMRSELNPNLPRPVKSFRITVSLLTMVVMGIVVFWRQRLLRAELSQLLDRSRRSFDDLKDLQNKLIQSEKLASLGQLVGGAAHEINNPLTAMLGYSDLLSASNLPPQEQLQAAQIGEQVRRTTTLVASLLTFARQAPARFAAVEVNSVLQTAVRLLAPQLEAEAISSRLDLAPSLPFVLADSNQILHVCMHLAGQICADLNRDEHSILFVRTHRQGDLVLVDFSSYDPGDPSSQPPSYPSLLSSEGRNKPSTLSLSACCRIVEEHGGRLLHNSTPDNPAFRMELRIAANSANRSSLAAATRAAARSSS